MAVEAATGLTPQDRLPIDERLLVGAAVPEQTDLDVELVDVMIVGRNAAQEQ